MKYKLLIVDDETANLRLLDRLFSQDYQCLTASCGTEAIRLLEQHDVAIIITDQRMPGMTGIDLLKQTATKRPHMVRILLTGYTDVEALVDAINSGLVYMYFTKPWNNDDLKFQVNRAREHYENNKTGHSLALANNRLLLRLKEIKQGIVSSLAQMSAGRSQEAYEYALRVRNTACAVAQKLELNDEEREDIAAAAILNDLGPVNFSIRPSGSFSAENVALTHVECESQLLSSMPELAGIVDMLFSQRENFDGTGTPRGARGEQIPIGSRILRVAEEYNSLLRPKSSVATMTHEDAMRFLSQRSGKQFDPKVLAIIEELGVNALSRQTSETLEIHRSPVSPFVEQTFEQSFADPILT
jgi:response regulator RpfG family c-di-GMP phosphodiesterase